MQGVDSARPRRWGNGNGQRQRIDGVDQGIHSPENPNASLTKRAKLDANVAYLFGLSEPEFAHILIAESSALWP